MYADWKEIYYRLTRSQRSELFAIIRQRFKKSIHHRKIRPIDLLMPALVAQMGIFIHSLSLPPEKTVWCLVLGNYLVFGWAIIPAFRPRRFSCWIRS